MLKTYRGCGSKLFFLINISYFFDKMQGLKMYGNFISTAHP